MFEPRFNHRLLIFVIVLLLLPAAAFAQDAVKIPDEVRPFVDEGMIPIALEVGDLNGDKRRDFVLVLSEVVTDEDRYEEGSGERSVRLLIRDEAGALQVFARNEVAAMCKSCGGAFGDPFEGIVVRRTQFTIMNYGGSAHRWAYSYTFDYSRRDRNWQLVRVEESNFHTLDPEKTMKRRIYTAPKNFGLINFEDFDPDKFLGVGKR